MISRVEDARKEKPALRVLDLGGGTGQNIATHFFSDPNIHWTYVDFCPAMVEQLDLHLDGRQLYRNLYKCVDDINHIHLSLQPRSFDVVLMSLVLTSMPQLPDFANIAGLLAPNGKLIISDINPLYTEIRPLYHATAQDGSIVAMRMKAVQPLQIARRAEAAGLHQCEITEQIGEAGISYSFITTFVASVRSRPRRTYVALPGRTGKHLLRL
jgi:SAM-dependent methyltransferase